MAEAANLCEHILWILGKDSQPVQKSIAEIATYKGRSFPPYTCVRSFYFVLDFEIQLFSSPFLRSLCGDPGLAELLCSSKSPYGSACSIASLRSICQDSDKIKRDIITRSAYAQLKYEKAVSKEDSHEDDQQANGTLSKDSSLRSVPGDVVQELSRTEIIQALSRNGAFHKADIVKYLVIQVGKRGRREELELQVTLETIIVFPWLQYSDRRPTTRRGNRTCGSNDGNHIS